MNWLKRFLMLFVLLAGGCGRESTDQLIADLKAPDVLTRIKTVRTLPQRQEAAAQVVPALIEALNDENTGTRRGAALGLGTFGEQANDAVPVLQKMCLADREASVRRAARIALSYINPQRFPEPSKTSR